MSPTHSERRSGLVTAFDYRRGYGTIRAADQTELLVHKNCMNPGELAKLTVGCRVTYAVDIVPRGLIARDVTIVQTDSEDDDPLLKPPKLSAASRSRSPKAAQDWETYVSQALFLRAQRKFSEAEQVYEVGLRNASSVQLIISYASFEKDRRNLQKALELLQLGIERFPTSIMLYRDAANVATRLNQFEVAIALLTTGIARGKGKIALLHQMLGEAYARTKNWAKAREHLNLAQRSGFSAAPQTVRLVDLMQGPVRGRRLYDFLSAADFTVSILGINSGPGACADLLVRAADQEFRESFDLDDHYFFRCFFQDTINLSHLQQFENDITGRYQGLPASRELAFISVGDADGIYTNLYNRLFDTKATRALIPITDPDLSQNAKHSLRELLTHWLFQRDLYKGTFPVSGRRFFGRERILKDIQSNIDHGNHVGIFGLRKAGKTSVLYQIRDKNQEEIVVYLDLLKIVEKDCRYLFWHIAQLISDELKAKFSEIAERTSFQLFGKYQNYLSIAKPDHIPLLFDQDLRLLSQEIQRSPLAHKPLVLLMIDEVERMLPGPGRDGFAGYHDFFSYIRGVSQQDQLLVSVVAGADPSITEAPQWERRDNPMFNFYELLYLPMLESRECAEMITKIGAGMAMQYSADIVDRIVRATGGHPFLTRQLCSYVAGRWRERPLNVTSTMVDEAEEWFLFHESKSFEEIFERFDRDFPDEQRVLTLIATRGGTATLSELTSIFGFHGRAPLRHLLGYQLLTHIDDRFVFHINLLHRWLEKRLGSA